MRLSPMFESAILIKIKKHHFIMSTVVSFFDLLSKESLHVKSAREEGLNEITYFLRLSIMRLLIVSICFRVS